MSNRGTVVHRAILEVWGRSITTASNLTSDSSDKGYGINDQGIGVRFSERVRVQYILTAIGLTPGGSSTVHIYTQTTHRTTQ